VAEDGSVHVLDIGASQWVADPRTTPIFTPAYMPSDLASVRLLEHIKEKELTCRLQRDVALRRVTSEEADEEWGRRRRMMPDYSGVGHKTDVSCFSLSALELLLQQLPCRLIAGLDSGRHEDLNFLIGMSQPAGELVGSDALVEVPAAVRDLLLVGLAAKQELRPSAEQMVSLCALAAFDVARSLDKGNDRELALLTGEVEQLRLEEGEAVEQLVAARRRGVGAAEWDAAIDVLEAAFRNRICKQEQLQKLPAAQLAAKKDLEAFLGRPGVEELLRSCKGMAQEMVGNADREVTRLAEALKAVEEGGSDPLAVAGHERSLAERRAVASGWAGLARSATAAAAASKEAPAVRRPLWRRVLGVARHVTLAVAAVAAVRQAPALCRRRRSPPRRGGSVML